MYQKLSKIITVYRFSCDRSIVSCHSSFLCTSLPCAPFPRLVLRPTITPCHLSLDPILPINPSNPICIRGISFPILYMHLLLISHRNPTRILQDGRVIGKLFNTESSRSSFGLRQTRWYEPFGSLPQPCQATIPHTGSTSLSMRSDYEVFIT